MVHQLSILAKGPPWPPSVNDFYLPGWHYPWVTKFTVMVWLAVAIIIVFFLVAYRKPALVPSRTQWLAESIYGFGRNGIAGDVIGPEGARFAPYITTLFVFIAVMNLFGIVPGFQVAPTAHIAFPAALALISYVLYLWVGVRRHGLRRFLKRMFVPAAAPAWLLPVMAPLEALENFILRPFTLSVRLFANMFAGHFILQVFTLGGFMLYGSGLLFKPLSLVSWAVAIAVTFLEFLVAALQAYVFAMLNSFYLSGSLSEEH
ncbi:MAG TPA: F0F1 ATP synthase subunit A [Rugosimonospora sp.]